MRHNLGLSQNKHYRQHLLNYCNGPLQTLRAFVWTDETSVNTIHNHNLRSFTLNNNKGKTLYFLEPVKVNYVEAELPKHTYGTIII